MSLFDNPEEYVRTVAPEEDRKGKPIRTVTVSIKLSPDEYGQIDVLRNKKHITTSDMVRRLVLYAFIHGAEKSLVSPIQAEWHKIYLELLEKQLDEQAKRNIDAYKMMYKNEEGKF